VDGERVRRARADDALDRDHLEPHPDRQLRHALREGRRLFEPGGGGSVAARRLHLARRADPLAARATLGARPPRALSARDDLRAHLHSRALRRGHPPRLGLHADRVLGGQPSLRPPGRAARGARSRSGHLYLIATPERPSGSSSWTSVASTRASGGPVRAKETSRSTASGSPSNTASTVPSEVLRAQPETPCRSASRRSESRKKTPWTLPWTTTRRRTRRRLRGCSGAARPASGGASALRAGLMELLHG